MHTSAHCGKGVKALHEGLHKWPDSETSELRCPSDMQQSICSVCACVQDVKRHDDPDLVVLATDECLFADEGFRSVKRLFTK